MAKYREEEDELDDEEIVISVGWRTRKTPIWLICTMLRK